MLAWTASLVVIATMPTREIAPGVHMPIISIGTWKSESGIDAYDIVTKWLKNSETGIDTALIYGDQGRVAAAIADSGLKRSDIFLTSKIPGCQGAALTKAAVDADLRYLNTTFIDLMLMHSPYGIGCTSTWKALESLVSDGKLRAIGISNFEEKNINSLCADGGCSIMPAVNQIDYSVMHHDDATIAFCKSKNITVEAYSPLGGTHGTKSVFSNPTVMGIAAKHNVSAAQVALRWIVQRGDVLTVLSESSAHQQNDADLWSFELEETEMVALGKLSA